MKWAISVLVGLIAIVSAHAADLSGELSEASVAKAARDGSVRVLWSPGGSGAGGMALSRTHLVIDGRCVSACAWAFATAPDACYTNRALLVFHVPYDPGTGKPMMAALEYWLSVVPASLASQLEPMRHGAEFVTVSRLPSEFKRCPL